MEGGEGSGRVAAEAVASLNGCDDALEVGAVKQLRQLQKAVAQHEHLAKRRGMHRVEQSGTGSTPPPHVAWMNITNSRYENVGSKLSEDALRHKTEEKPAGGV